MKFLITGGHSGIGLSLTRKLLAEDHHIGLIVRSEKRKIETLKHLQGISKLEIFVADLGKRDEIESATNEIKSTWPLIDGLFNNAGVLLDQLYVSDSGNEMQLEINAISPYLLSKTLLPLLKKSKTPFVVSTATAALNKKKSLDIPAFKKPAKFSKLMGSYMDSKITMVALMNALAKQHEKVRFVHVNPGAIKTKMTAGSGMPLLLKPIRNIFFKSPDHGANELYNAAFGTEFQKSGLYISGGKIKPIQVEITPEQIEELLRND
ncbi:MAG: SDR family oxidoreductase [Bacteroidota bacterium]